MKSITQESVNNW